MYRVFLILIFLGAFSTHANDDSYELCINQIVKTDKNSSQSLAERLCDRYSDTVISCGIAAYKQNKRYYSSGYRDEMISLAESAWLCQNHGIERVETAMDSQKYGTSLKSYLN